jgi:hypothetical protein
MLAIIAGWQDYWELYHKVTFDGENKLIIPNDGVTEIDVEKDIYSDYKEWVGIYDHTKFVEGVRTVAGDPTVGLDSLGATFFMTNGWRILLNQGITFTGNLFSDDFASPFVVADGIQLAQQKFSNLVDSPGLDQTGIAPAVWGADNSLYATASTMGGEIQSGLGLSAAESNYLVKIFKRLGLDPNDPAHEKGDRFYVESSTLVQTRTGDPDTEIIVTTE